MIVSAILLAAGESKRMGRLKQLLPWQSSTMLEQTIDNLLASSLHETIVVVGYQAKEVTEAIGNRPVKVVANPNYEQGMSASIIAGLKTAKRQAQAFVIAFADQPLVSSQTIDRLINEFKNHDKGIVIPTYRGQRGHPVIFGIKYKQELLKLTGDIGGRQLVKAHPEDVFEVTIDSDNILTDIDTLRDYLFYLEQS
ncbi:molybdenum cofactor cytidylyltransferase [Chloroflexota bacterium]